MEFRKERVVVPYKEKSPVEVDDFELIKALKEDIQNPLSLRQYMSFFKQRPPTDIYNNIVPNNVNNVLYQILKDRREGALETSGIPIGLRASLEDLLNEDLGEYYYLDEYETFFDIDSFPVITEINKEQKILQFYIEVLNQLFKPFKKSYVSDFFYVEIPEEIIDDYHYFINNKLYLQRSKSNNELFELINNYFKTILYNKTHNFTIEKIFHFTGLGERVSFDEESNILSIKIDLNADIHRYIDSNINQFYYQLWFFSAKVIDFFTTTELIGLLRENSTDLNVDEEKDLFLEEVSNRRVLLSEITHKGAAKKADSLGLTHLFLPLDEEAIPAGLPFSLKTELKNHDKITNIWTIIPPLEGFSVIRRYIGHNNDYSDYTTLTEPHLLGMELIKTKMDENFYEILVDNYDWEYKEEAKKTLQLIKEYPRLGNDLDKIAKERSAND